MKADISRDTFQAARDIRRVVAQQGRPWLDADWNEQVAVLLHRLETLAADIFGEHAAIANGFNVVPITEGRSPQGNTFSVARGRYYVHGLMCENDVLWEPPSGSFDVNSSYLVYLHAWEEYESGAQDPTIMEPALRGVDTTGRTHVRWRVGWQKEKGPVGTPENALKAWAVFKEQRELAPTTLSLRIRADPAGHESPRGSGRAVYRGVENTLYRVEVHSVEAKTAFIKWARNNASSVLSVSAQGSSVKCHASGDLDRSFQPDGWVELSPEDADTFPGAHGQLHRIEALDREANLIHLSPPPAAGEHLLARPWLNVLEIKLPVTNPAWISLDQGLEFKLNVAADTELRPGQYWVMPIRTEGGGQVYWPAESDGGVVRRWLPLDDRLTSALKAAPHESDLTSHEIATAKEETPLNRAHYYGPLAMVSFDGTGKVTILDLRAPFEP